MLRRRSPSALRHFQLAAARSFVGIFGGHDKTMSAAEAAGLINDGDTICVSGFVAQSPPEAMLKAIAERYEKTQQPAGLTLAFHGGPGDWADKGLNRLALKGLLKKTIAAHYGQTPRIADLVFANEITAYMVPMGTMCRMIRAGASGRPGYSTTVGLGTLVDPRLGGGRLNAKTSEDLARVVKNPAGTEVLFYPALDLNVAIIRGTTADPDGNITMERESLYLDVLNQAMAARSNGGLVICQVERLAAVNSLNPRLVRVPGALVDVVVVAEDPLDHPMSFITQYSPAYSGEIRVPKTMQALPLDERKIIARRAALNLLPGQVVNLGIGMPEGVAAVAGEENVLDQVSLTTEPGTHGGLGASGHDFGPATNYSGLLEMHQQFDFYNGGGLDVCFLGMAEVTQNGDVNVTRVGKKLTGPGGFIDISQCTQRVNLLGTMTAGGLDIEVTDGKIKIVKEGKIKKFVNKIPEITFSGDMARKTGQIVRYITERCVFSLHKDGLALTEVAPGVDVQRDILNQMEFKPLIPHEPREMNPKIFREELMELSEALLHVNMKTRLFYSDEPKNTLFVDLAAVHVRKREDIDTIVNGIEQFFEAELDGKRANVEINYFGFKIANDIFAEFQGRAAALEAKYYLTVRRHRGRTFTHLKAAQPRHRLPDRLSLKDAQQYVHRHHFAVGEEYLTDLFHHVSGGRDEINRAELTEVIERILHSKQPLHVQSWSR
jgi:propionate CoA-transferase